MSTTIETLSHLPEKRAVLPKDPATGEEAGQKII